MASYVLTVNEKNAVAKGLLDYLKLLSKKNEYVSVVPHKESSINGLDEAIEDIKMGRVTTYENYEEYEKATNNMLGYV